MILAIILVILVLYIFFSRKDTHPIGLAPIKDETAESQDEKSTPYKLPVKDTVSSSKQKAKAVIIILAIVPSLYLFNTYIYPFLVGLQAGLQGSISEPTEEVKPEKVTEVTLTDSYGVAQYFNSKPCYVISEWRLDNDIAVPRNIQNNLKNYGAQLAPDSYSDQALLINGASEQYQYQQIIANLKSEKIYIRENRSISDGAAGQGYGDAYEEKGGYRLKVTNSVLQEVKSKAVKECKNDFIGQDLYIAKELVGYSNMHTSDDEQ